MYPITLQVHKPRFNLHRL